MTESIDGDRARHLFEDGVSLAESGRWEAALSTFRKSSELVRRASTSYNIANTLYRLDCPVQGLAELDKYHQMPAVRADPSAKKRGIALRALLETQLAEARLATTPTHSDLRVDEDLTPLSTAPSGLAPGASQAVPRSPEPKRDDRKAFVKRPGFWAMIGAIAAVGIGTGVAVAVLRKDDAPQCGTTGTCATTRGTALVSF
ncbi:MAG: hypothetical protein WCF10_13520 [Polyangiales bacterium]